MSKIEKSDSWASWLERLWKFIVADKICSGGTIMTTSLSILTPISSTLGLIPTLFLSSVVGLILFLSVSILWDKKFGKKQVIKDHEMTPSEDAIKPKKLEEVVGINFINESVVLNKKFVNCRFDACTLQYTGEDFEFYQESVLIGEDCRFEFKTKDSAMAAHLIYDFYTALQDKNTQFMLWDSYSIPRKKPEVVLKSK
jgi:hypothetical protein